jgi:hypothetical protein
VIRFPRSIAAAVVVLSALGGAVPPAGATFHEMSVREVYPGSVAEPTGEYVELQMWHSGQNLVGGHTLRTYDAGGSPTATVLPSDVTNDANQSTILIATAGAEAKFGLVADAPLAASDQLDPAGGAVCWEAIDCVAWGSFGGNLPSAAGTPAAAISDGMALRRTIAPGCPTLLEPADDRNDSAMDFFQAFPAPRPNSVAPSEYACAAPTGEKGRSGSGSAPQTRLRHTPPHRTHDRTPSFRFSADEPAATFQCKIDRERFRRCSSPFTAGRLRLGRHTFRVRARNEAGRFDPTPASYRFEVLASR